MSTTLEKIAAGDVSRIPAEQGVSKDKPVTVLVDEDMSEIARLIRVKAKARGMADEVFGELTKNLCMRLVVDTNLWVSCLLKPSLFFLITFSSIHTTCPCHHRV